MKNLSKKQIEEVKKINQWSSLRFHGNTKKVGDFSINNFKSIIEKKINRDYLKLDVSKKSNASIIRDLINNSLKAVGTPYFKILIEGETGIYYASPVYNHHDYNKSRLFDKTPQTIKLMELFNSYVQRKKANK